MSEPADGTAQRSKPRTRLRFAEYTLDPAGRELLRGTERVHLSPKALELLELLAAARPVALSKSELQDSLWPHTFVVEANLSNLVAEIRAALDDDPRQPRFIRTVHGFGYAFCGDAGDGPAAAETAAASRLFYLSVGQVQIRLTEGEHLIGRHPDSIVPIDSETVSRCHAKIQVSADAALLTDLSSRNGTYLRGEKIETASPLRNGDEIRIGPVVLSFHVAPLESPTRDDISPSAVEQAEMLRQRRQPGEPDAPPPGSRKDVGVHTAEMLVPAARDRSARKRG